MKNNKNQYVSPSFEIINVKAEDVISTSTFDSKEHLFRDEPAEEDATE